MTLANATPVLRVFDASKAHEFYVEFLGFAIDWRYRRQPDLPAYTQISRDACVLHLTEHHGDCTPGSAIRITVDDIESLKGELGAKSYRYARPSLAETDWQTQEMLVTDPFGNRLTFAAPAKHGDQ
ncbi:MAG: glyoxalase superfamily protein [Planctomycetota bacterium]